MPSQPDVSDLPDLLPWPASVDVGNGSMQLTSALVDPEFLTVHSDRLMAAVRRFGTALGKRSGLPARQPATRVHIACQALSDRYPGIIEDEGYWLVVDDAGIYLEAAGEWGILRGLATLTQLIGPQGRLPHIAIEDAPRFPWRGLLLDPARHFLDAASIRRTLDGMALCKLNVLHLHLSDDQGFRFPSEAHPKLASDPAYTVAELRELIEQAADLGIRIVPELDMPGHVTSWLMAYPEWGNRQAAASRNFGVHAACLDPTSERTYEAIDRLLDEVAAIFPDPCIHVGGDEVHARWWREDEHIAAFMVQHKLTDTRDLQAYFNARVRELVIGKGRQIVGWDEVLHERLDADWIVQAWRGSTMRDRIAANGNRVLESAPYYLDLNYPAGLHHAFDPAADQADLLALEDAMLLDPRFAHVAEGMRWTLQWRKGALDAPEMPEPVEALLGGEACLWGELVDAQVLDVRLWSRLPAVAERLWSNVLPEASFYPRLEWYLDVIHPLQGFNLVQRSRSQIAQLGVDERWVPLLDMLEPVKWYGRLLGEQALAARIAGTEMPQARPYQADTPLNGIADYLPPESLLGRRVDGWSATLDTEGRRQLEALAVQWRTLSDAGYDGAESATLTPLLAALGSLGELILQRLTEDRAIEPAQVKALMKPRGELMLAIGTDLYHWLVEAG